MNNLFSLPLRRVNIALANFTLDYELQTLFAVATSRFRATMILLLMIQYWLLGTWRREYFLSRALLHLHRLLHLSGRLGYVFERGAR